MTPTTENQLRETVTRFVEGVKSATGDHLVKVEARDEDDTHDACRRMSMIVSWSDAFGNTSTAVRSFMTQPDFRLVRFADDLDAFVILIRLQAQTPRVLH